MGRTGPRSLSPGDLDHTSPCIRCVLTPKQIATGWIGDDDIRSYLHNGTKLRGLCESDVPGCEVSSGSLGHGLPVAVGMAYGLARLHSRRRVWCIVGDGEMNEGSMWEAMLFAAHRRTDSPRCAPPCPRAVIARTVKGHGLSFAAADNRWHYTRPDEATRTAAIEEHTNAGGLWSLVLEMLHAAGSNFSPRFEAFGLRTMFIATAGDHQHALGEHDLDDDHLARRLAAWLNAERPLAD